MEKIVVSSVRADILYELETELSDIEFLKIKSSLIPSYYLGYETPKSLGVDRFLVCLGACSLTPKNVVVIDAGTACTIDMMSSDKIFRGGVIMPGIKIFHESMSNSLPELPAVDTTLPKEWPGKSTVDCIRWGVNGAFFYSIISFIEKFREQVENIEVFITGGDAAIITENLNEVIPVKYRPNLLFDGMEQFESL
jgi:type III pantothenate kinase